MNFHSEPRHGNDYDAIGLPDNESLYPDKADITKIIGCRTVAEIVELINKLERSGVENTEFGHGVLLTLNWLNDPSSLSPME